MSESTDSTQVEHVPDWHLIDINPFGYELLCMMIDGSNLFTDEDTFSHCQETGEIKISGDVMRRLMQFWQSANDLKRSVMESGVRESELPVWRDATDADIGKPCRVRNHDCDECCPWHEVDRYKGYSHGRHWAKDGLITKSFTRCQVKESAS